MRTRERLIKKAMNLGAMGGFLKGSLLPVALVGALAMRKQMQPTPAEQQLERLALREKYVKPLPKVLPSKRHQKRMFEEFFRKPSLEGDK